MPLSADTLLDRIRLKSQIHLWRGCAIALLVLLGLALIGSTMDGLPGKNYIARITVDGMIEEDQHQTEELKKLEEDYKVKAVILHVNSPGGTVVGGEDLYRNLKDLAAKKPLVVVMGTLATSAAYMASIPAHHIVAREGTITGSIGVLLQSAEIVELTKKLGIDLTVIKSSPLKAVPSPFERLTPEGKASVQNLIDDFYQVFVDMIVEGRKMPKDKVLKIADGRVFTGRQALQLKLIDEIGNEKQALLWLHKNKQVSESLDVKDVDIHKKENEGLEGVLGAVFGPIFNAILGSKKYFGGTSTQGLLSVYRDGIVLSH